MSYSFHIRAASKDEASKKVAEQLEKVATSQPIHAGDQEAAQAAANAFIGLVRDDDTQDIAVSVNGSCWSVEAGFNSVGFGVTASLIAKES